MSATPASASGLDIEAAVNQYLERLRQIDSILKEPIRTFIAAPHLPLPAVPLGRELPQDEAAPLIYPASLAEDEPPARPSRVDEMDMDVQSLCAITFQRLRRIQRRLAWLSGTDRDRLRADGPGVLGTLTREWNDADAKLRTDSFWILFNAIHSPTYGGLNALTASQVFRLLMEEGEGQAHRGIGFLSFFTMIWPLYRKHPDPLNRGARIEPSEPTAYLTAKCLLPLIRLQVICTRRKELLAAIATSVENLVEVALRPTPTPHQRWTFNAELDELRAHLFAIRDIAISREAFKAAADRVGAVSDALTLRSSLSDELQTVLAHLEEALEMVGTASSKILDEASGILKEIDANVITALAEADPRVLEGRLKLPLNHAYLATADAEDRRAYFADLHNAAREAHTLCRDALSQLDAARLVGNSLAPLAPIRKRAVAVVNGFRRLARSNDEVADSFDRPIRNGATWCKTVVDREVAYASARNISDFDPAELVSGMAVAVQWHLMTTPMQVRDAVKRALDGVWSDGSWRLGRPFFTQGALGIRPPTADVLWTLASTLGKQPSVNEADDALFQYVDWLERTRRTVRMRDGNPATGWSGDRVGQPTRIHLTTTALCIHGLLEIRNMVEHRLWELCQKRFSVFSEGRRLGGVFPVDLNRPHRDRLHSYLSGMARAGRKGGRAGPYSLVFHGPPGSSKTVLSEALSQQMWQHTRRWGVREPRLIRITPADFTRQGEDRLDSEARLVFNLLRHVRAVTVLFDEIDDLMLRREGTGGRRFMDLVVPAMLNRIQDLRSACPHQEICFVFGTNFVENIEPALIRKGRIDRAVAVVYPDWNTRLATLTRHLDSVTPQLHQKLGADGGWGELRTWLGRRVREVANETSGWPWLVLDSLAEKFAEELEELQKPVLPERLAQLEQTIEAHIARERAGLAEPAYIGRLLRRFDSPELRTEYGLHLLSRSTRPETPDDVMTRANREFDEYILAHFSDSEHPRQQQIWERQIAAKLRDTVTMLLTLGAESFLTEPEDYVPAEFQPEPADAVADEEVGGLVPV